MEKIITTLKDEIEFTEYKKVKNQYNFPPMKKIGVRTPILRKIANDFFLELNEQGIIDIDIILGLCENLLSERLFELRVIAFQWAFKMKRKFLSKHFVIFENWVNMHVTDWASCDDLCVGNLGYFLYSFPEFIPNVKSWVTSENPMVRRACAVTFIYSLRREKYLEHIFDISDALLNDEDIYVLKGYGWMLKEASNNYQKEIFNYVQKKKKNMPRVSLRYAIEKMPQDLRKKAMSKE
ncbi:MAG: DNA alkylation repair protein [Candidatus Heimdallarchaeota archaeon]